MNRGEFLANQRLKAGLSQNDVAEELGYSAQLISLWEKDKASPDISVIAKYAFLLNVDLNGFIYCKTIKKNNNCGEKKFNINKFSTNLRYLRKNSGLKQADLANKIKTNVKAVGAWESGKSTPSIDEFVSLCSVFNKTFDELLFVIDENNEEIIIKPSKRLPIIVGAVLGVVFISVSSLLAVSLYKHELALHAPCKHTYNVETINPTYDSDGLSTYTCSKCGYSYEEVIPQLVHQYSTDWSYNETHHYHSCIDAGYEDLFIDNEEHNFSHITLNGVTTYTCSICDYSFDTADYITVLDIYSENSDKVYSISQRTKLFFKVLNPTKYNLTTIGYVITNSATGTSYDGYIPDNILSCLDSEYSLFSIGSFFESFSGFLVPGNILKFKLTETYKDPNLHGVNCGEFFFTIME